jgi:tetratricopeptide (TPR) repeat protein
LREELRPQGVEVVTVALDAGGAEAAGSFIDYAKPQHPSLIDETHVLDARLGITNVPMAVWVDEDGTLVRPPEVAHPGRVGLQEIIEKFGVPDDAPQYLLETMAETANIRIRPKRYAAALRDWAEKGAESEFALSPDEVVERSRPRPPEHSRAAAHFELGQLFHAENEVDAARAHFREAHRLDPDNWTYKRQAWSFEDPLQGPSEHYEGHWVKDVREAGAENY